MASLSNILACLDRSTKCLVAWCGDDQATSCLWFPLFTMQCFIQHISSPILISCRLGQKGPILNDDRANRTHEKISSEQNCSS